MPDPRRARGIRHQLPGILAVGIAAVAAGARSFAAIGQWAADADENLLAALGATRGRVPSKSAIRRTFSRLDAAVLDSVLAAWLLTRTQVVGQRRVIAIDGETLRGARTRDQVAPHLVAAFDHHTGTVLGQLAISAKSNEIPAARTLLSSFDLAGAGGHRLHDAHPDRHRPAHRRRPVGTPFSPSRATSPPCTQGLGKVAS